MTLLEAMVALVILGASAAGFLGVFQAGAQSAQRSREWLQAATVAEATMEESIRARLEGGSSGIDPTTGPGEPVAVVAERPWSPSVDDLVVEVRLPDGRTMTVHRLVRRR